MTGGDKRRMNIHLSFYKSSIGENIVQLDKAVNEKNYANVRTSVHASKPQFTTMGFNNIWELANDIEVQIDEGKSVEGIPAKVKNLLALMKDSLKELDNLA